MATVAVFAPSVLRRCYRWGAALLSAGLVGWGVWRWSAQEALRFPTLGLEGADYHFPFVGDCRAGEYFFLLADAMLLIGAAAYFLAMRLEQHADT